MIPPYSSRVVRLWKYGLALLLVSACSGEESAPATATATPTAVASGTPTATTVPPTAIATFTATATPSPTPTPTILVDVERLVSPGASLSFNNQTGGANDLRLHPTTKRPAVVYYDKSANVSGTTAVGALKYAYLDAAGSWNIEVIDANFGAAACGTANSFCVGAPNAATGNVSGIVALAFTTAGNPVVAYVYGASLATVGGTKQIRYAERDTAGNWTVTIAFSSPTAALATNAATAATVDPMKAIRLLLDAQNRPHITFAFYTQTLSNSTLKYLYRTTGGTWLVSDALAGLVTGAGTITAIGQGMSQGGAFLCPLDSAPSVTAFVVDAAAGSGKTRYLRCTALNPNGSCSTWAAQTVQNGCTASACFSSNLLTTSNAGQRTDLVLDPVSNRPILGIYSTATPATSLFTSKLPNPCDQAQPTAAGSWGPPDLVGASSEGAKGFRLAASASTLLLAYNKSTTSVVVDRFTTGWLAPGSTVETVTVSDEGLSLGYDSANDAFYVAYAAIPAGAAGAAGNDLRVASGLPADIISAGTAGRFAVDTVDTLVSLFPTTAIPMLSADIAPNGTVGYSYFFQDTTAADSKLYYGVRSGSPTNPIFSQTFVTNVQEGGASPQFVGAFPSLTYDSTNNPVIAYYNGITTEQNLQVARSSTNGSSFSITVVDDTADVGQYATTAVTGSAIGVAYYDVTNTALKFARYLPATGWSRFTVDGNSGAGSCGNTGDIAGKYAKLVFTSSGRPAIAYQANNGLRIALAAEAATSATFSWTCLNLDVSASQRGEGIDFVLSGVDIPHLAHFDASAGTVRYLTCGSAIATCVTAGAASFPAELVSATGTSAAVVTKPTIRVTASGTRYLAFYSASFQGLALASRALGSPVWSFEYIDPLTSGASFTSLAGQYAVLLLNASQLPLLFYRSNENWLKYFSREPQ